MIVTAWNNGGTGYGIRVAPDDRDRYFSRLWRNLRIQIADNPPRFRLTPVTDNRFKLEEM